MNQSKSILTANALCVHQSLQVSMLASSFLNVINCKVWVWLKDGDTGTITSEIECRYVTTWFIQDPLNLINTDRRGL